MNMLSNQLLAGTTTVNVSKCETYRASMSKRAKGISSYGQVQEQEVARTTSASELVTMLFDKACALLKASTISLETGDNQTFHQSALHALQIVLSLRFVLDTDGDRAIPELFRYLHNHCRKSKKSYGGAGRRRYSNYL